MTEATATTPGTKSVAEIATPNASRYLQQICKHFAHKTPSPSTKGRGISSFRSVNAGSMQKAAR